MENAEDSLSKKVVFQTSGPSSGWCNNLAKHPQIRPASNLGNCWLMLYMARYECSSEIDWSCQHLPVLQLPPVLGGVRGRLSCLPSGWRCRVCTISAMTLWWNSATACCAEMLDVRVLFLCPSGEVLPCTERFSDH